MDCGAHRKEILKSLDYELISIDGVLITHIHGDHAGGAEYFTDLGIPVYSCKEVADNIPGVECIPSKSVKRVGKFRVIPFSLPHEATENYGYLIQLPNGESFMYATDYAYIPYSFKKYNIDYLLLECNYTDLEDEEDPKHDHVKNGHASLEVVKNAVKVNATKNLKRVILCHLSLDNADPAVILPTIEDVVPSGTEVDIAERLKIFSLGKGGNVI